MALLTQAVVGYELRVTFGALDSNGALHVRDQVYEITAASQADADTAAADMITDLTAVTQADIVGFRLTRVSGTADAVTSVAQLHKIAVLTLRSATAGAKNMPHNIIAPATAILTNGTVVNAGAAAVGNYLANLFATPGVRISDGEAIASTNPIAASRVKTVSSGKNYVN